MTYSIDFRKKVLAIKAQESHSFVEVANRFGVGKTGSFAVFSGQLQLTTGIGDFQFVSSHFNYVNQIYQPNPCHAKYTYADDALNQGGLLHLPFISRAKAVISILVAGLKRVR